MQDTYFSFNSGKTATIRFSIGEISFFKPLISRILHIPDNPQDKIQSRFALRPVYSCQQKKVIMGEWTVQQFRRFIDFVMPFGDFSIEDHVPDLNF
jgi:hypothetical protein